MKKKDILTVVVCVLVIIGAGYYLFTVMAPPKNTVTPTQNNNNNTKTEFTGDIDQNTLNEIKKFNDYGEANLDNIGRVNPFGPLN
jgi:uncharacterized protein YxeA